MKFSFLEACLPAYWFVDIDIIMPVRTAVLTNFSIFLVMFCRVLFINGTELLVGEICFLKKY